MNVLPKVSFFIITYNHENYIKEAIESALNQDYRGEIEYIISDDCSTDQTYKTILSVIKNRKENIHLNRFEKNYGLATNVNYVLNSSTGNYIIFGDGDDTFLPSRVSSVVLYFRRNPNAIMVDCGYNVMDGSGKIYFPVNQNAGQIYTIKDLNIKHKIWCNGCGRTINRELLSLFPPLNTNLYDHDMPIIARALLCNKEIHIIGDILVNYRIHENNLTNAKNIKNYKRNALCKQYMSDIKHAIRNNYFPRKNIISVWGFFFKYFIATILLKSTFYVAYIQPIKKKIFKK